MQRNKKRLRERRIWSFISRPEFRLEGTSPGRFSQSFLGLVRMRPLAGAVSANGYSHLASIHYEERVFMRDSHKGQLNVLLGTDLSRARE